MWAKKWALYTAKYNMFDLLSDGNLVSRRTSRGIFQGNLGCALWAPDAPPLNQPRVASSQVL